MSIICEIEQILVNNKDYFILKNKEFKENYQKFKKNLTKVKNEKNSEAKATCLLISSAINLLALSIVLFSSIGTPSLFTISCKYNELTMFSKTSSFKI